MQKNLTHAVVEGLKPPTDRPQIDIWDHRRPGFGIRVSKGGSKTWLLMYRQHDGRKRRFTLGRFPELSVADARSKAASVLGDIAKGQDPAAERAAEKAAETFGELAELYLRHHAIPKKKPRSVREDQYMLAADLLPRWEHRKLTDIRRRDVIALLDEIVARGAPVHANRVRALCSTMFNFAIARDLLEFNPAHKTPRPVDERSRERRLGDEELRRLWTALEPEPPAVATLFKLALFTAARRTEVCRMAWSELDLEQGWWTLPSHRSKGGREHRIPLSASALALLRQLRAAGDGDYVFPGRRRGQPLVNAQKLITRVRSRANLEDIRFHDLRRTVASGMTAIGIPRLTVSKVLGHSEGGSVTGIYDRHSYDAEKRAAVEKWDRHLQRFLTGRSNVVELRA